jgi:hypothetical protein
LTRGYKFLVDIFLDIEKKPSNMDLTLPWTWCAFFHPLCPPKCIERSHMTVLLSHKHCG